MTETTPAIYAAINEVMSGLTVIPRTGKMRIKTQKATIEYDYLKSDDVQERLHPLLVEKGIAVQAQYATREIVRATRFENSVQPYVNVDLEVTYFAVSDGSSLTVKSVGECKAEDDKAINKALTQAIKNAHRATFQFPSGEPEPDDRGAEDAKPPAATKVVSGVAKARAPRAVGLADSEKEAQQAIIALIESGTVTKAEASAAKKKYNGDPEQIAKTLKELTESNG